MKSINTYVQRGKLVESIHNVMCLIKDHKYKTILSTNNHSDLIYPRSAIKIFQAIPFIQSKAHLNYSLNQEQIAISCASHCGEKVHIKVLNKWLKKIKLKENNLKCGVHNVLDLESSNKLLLKGVKQNQIHNNCAGKHMGMLSGCLSNNMNLNNYLNLQHPYQKEIRSILIEFTETKIFKKQIGIDGCSAPQYSFPMENIAIAIIKLMNNYLNKNKYSYEVRVLLNSIFKFPYLTGGSKNFDSQLIKITNGKIFCKYGAEGILLFFHRIKKVGGIIKVTDGNQRAIPSSTIAILKKLSLLNKNEIFKLNKWENQKILNHKKIQTGKIFSKIL